MTSSPQDLRSRAKRLLRKIAIGGARLLLQSGSKPYALPETVTVVIAPHQDDETLGCGGVIARKRNEGLPVHVIFITDGSASHPRHPRLTPGDISVLRRQEAMQALALLGVERVAVHFLGEPDGTLKNIRPERRADLVERLGTLLRELGPAEIFLPCSPDGSSEHDATFGFVTDAIFRRQLHPVIWQYPVWSWWNPVLLVRRWLATAECRHLPVEDYMQAKCRAIDAYRSQISPLPPDSLPALPPELIENFTSGTEYFFRAPMPDALLPP
jgi:N-acetylglucosamine malate deacetylase 1